MSVSVVAPLTHFLDLHSISNQQFAGLLHLAKTLKDERTSFGRNEPLLSGKSLAMIFEKPSLRTRVSFETGMQHLGGHAIYLSPQEIGLGTRESAPDIARVLSGYNDAIMARVFKHDHILQLAQWATVPVINGLSDFSHPCQAIADIFTIWEDLGYPALQQLQGLTIAYVGDGANNVATSLVHAAGKVGMSMRIIAPAPYHPDPATLEGSDADVMVTEDLDGVIGADILYTDVWTSMGQETERNRRSAELAPYQLNADLAARTRNRSLRLMHCLPAHRGEEITDEVADSAASLLFIQAHNRLHAQKAILAHLIGKMPLAL